MFATTTTKPADAVKVACLVFVLAKGGFEECGRRDTSRLLCRLFAALLRLRLAIDTCGCAHNLIARWSIGHKFVIGQVTGRYKVSQIIVVQYETLVKVALRIFTLARLAAIAIGVAAVLRR